MSYKVEDPDRNVAIDFCRCIACIAVVIIHVLAPYWYSTPVLLTSIDEYKVGGGYTDRGDIWLESLLCY